MSLWNFERGYLVFACNPPFFPGLPRESGSRWRVVWGRSGIREKGRHSVDAVQAQVATPTGIDPMEGMLHMHGD